MKAFEKAFALLAIAAMANGCATICGGSNYIAHVKVLNHPNAKVSNEGMFEQTGNATFKVKRSNANKFIVVVREEGCATQTIKYTQRTFRGWAFVGTIVTWTGLSSGVPLLWGLALDLSTGALWKPSATETGIMKIDSKNYFYNVEYKGCENREVPVGN
jgi:hypothetical protein